MQLAYSTVPSDSTCVAGTATLSKSQHSVFAETQQFFVKQRYITFDTLTIVLGICTADIQQPYRAAVAKLRQDNAKLKEELLLENKFSVTPTTSNLSANIANLQDQSDVYTRKARYQTIFCCALCLQFRQQHGCIAWCCDSISFVAMRR